jgi:hypothetical protein
MVIFSDSERQYLYWLRVYFILNALKILNTHDYWAIKGICKILFPYRPELKPNQKIKPIMKTQKSNY